MSFLLFVAAASLIALSPVFLIVAAAVKLDSKGPVFFRQKRYGFNNELIEVFKFRSMYTDQLDHTASKLVTKGDPRVTRVGRFIRKTSIDELPQLFNVLKGDLSLVGPRPLLMEYLPLYTPEQARRHDVMPGITGWAQVNGFRGGTPRLELMERRVALDLWYIDNWSLALDVSIMLKTCFELIRRRNAY